RIGGLKGYADGSAGSRTAYFFEPYADSAGYSGLMQNTPKDLATWIGSADSAGLQVAVHAIGDRANAIILDIYDSVTRAHGPRDRRFRVEHAQHLRPQDIPRFGRLGVIPSMQPYHAIDDGRWVERRIGPVRIKTTYAFRTLLDTGAKLAFGSDWTVAPLDPITGVYAAVTRRTLDARLEHLTQHERVISRRQRGDDSTFDPPQRVGEDRRPGHGRRLGLDPPELLRRAGGRATELGGELALALQKQVDREVACIAD